MLHHTPQPTQKSQEWVSGWLDLLVDSVCLRGKSEVILEAGGYGRTSDGRNGLKKGLEVGKE